MKARWMKIIAWGMALMLLGANICAYADGKETFMLPSELKIIDEQAFSGDASLEKVVVPEGTLEIRSRAFADSSVIEIELPGSLEIIAEDAFEGCGVYSMMAPEGSYAYEWGVEHGFITNAILESAHPYAADSDEKWEYIYRGEAEALKVRFSDRTEFEQPHDVLIITDSRGVSRAYTGTELAGAELTLPGNIFELNLKSNGSVECFGFEIVSVDVIEYGDPEDILFETRTLNDGTLEITGCNAAYGDLVIPDEIGGALVSAIGDEAFMGCSMLESIELPEGMKRIGEAAFAGCEKLKLIVLPDSLDSVGDVAFAGCAGLETVVFQGGKPDVGAQAFVGCEKLENVLFLNDGAGSLGRGVFEGCTGLVEVVLPQGLESLPDDAFYGCSALTSVVLPEEIKYIGSNAFYGCHNLADTELPEGMTGIGEAAFANCYSLELVVLPDTIDFVGAGAFAGCMNLGVVVFQGGTADVGDRAFVNCGLLQNVIFNGGIGALGMRVFEGCASLVEVIFPEGLENLPQNTFYDCISLECVVLPEGVTSIGGGAFGGCGSLCRIQLPVSIEEGGIDVSAFDGVNPTMLTVYGEAGSAAESFAEENGCSFIAGSFA